MTSQDRIYLIDFRADRVELYAGVNPKADSYADPDGNGDGKGLRDCVHRLESRWSDPVGMAVTPNSQQLIVCDSGNRRLRTIDFRSGYVETAIGVTTDPPFDITRAVPAVPVPVPVGRTAAPSSGSAATGVDGVVSSDTYFFTTGCGVYQLKWGTGTGKQVQRVKFHYKRAARPGVLAIDDHDYLPTPCLAVQWMCRAGVVLIVDGSEPASIIAIDPARQLGVMIGGGVFVKTQPTTTKKTQPDYSGKSPALAPTTPPLPTYSLQLSSDEQYLWLTEYNQNGVCRLVMPDYFAF